jgi:hypothetical protein
MRALVTQNRDRGPFWVKTRPGRAIGICSHVRYATNSDDQLPNCDPSLRANRRHSVPASVAAPLRCQLGQQCIGFL